MIYGDYDRVPSDGKVLHEIQSRQGSGILIEVIAESVGRQVSEFKLNEMEARRILDSLVVELRTAILERI